MQYIVMGTKPNTTKSKMRTITAASARDAYLAFTKGGYVIDVSVIPVTVIDEEETN